MILLKYIRYNLSITEKLNDFDYRFNQGIQKYGLSDYVNRLS